MKKIASCSFGKDSVAAIIVALEHGIKIDEILYCRVMFDEKISAEYPEHEKFIHEVAIPKFYNEFGLKNTIIESKKYVDYFYKKYGERSKKIGQIYGFPKTIHPWCNDRLKMNAIKNYKKTQDDFISIVGIAVDETKRIERKIVSNAILPLVDHGITEDMTYDICRKHGLLSPAYAELKTKRLGCWFCPNQRVSLLRTIRKKHPCFWKKLLEMQKDSPVSFTPNYSMFDLEKRFSDEDNDLLNR